MKQISTRPPIIRGEKFDVKASVEQMDEDERMDWEERAAIMEYDGGMDREAAERAAYFDVKRQRAKR
jgi:hypothetical protein